MENRVTYAFAFQFSFQFWNENFLVGPTEIFISICSRSSFHSGIQIGGNIFHIPFSPHQLLSFEFSPDPNTALNPTMPLQGNMTTQISDMELIGYFYYIIALLVFLILFLILGWLNFVIINFKKLTIKSLIYTKLKIHTRYLLDQLFYLII